MASGYNKPGSRVWHAEQRCSGTFFGGAAAMSSQVAENRGLKPCGRCSDGEWPHKSDEDEMATDGGEEKILGKTVHLGEEGEIQFLRNGEPERSFLVQAGESFEIEGPDGFTLRYNGPPEPEEESDGER